MFGLELLQALLSAWDGREVFLSLVVLQSSGLGLFFPLFCFFFGQILMMCHLPNSYLSLKEVVLSFEFLAERLRGATRRLQEFLFGCLQYHVHYFCLCIPLCALKCFEELAEELPLNLSVLKLLEGWHCCAPA